MVARVLLVFLAAVTTVAAEGQPQLLCFGAPWCAPCRELEPTLDALSRAGYPLQRIDIDAHPSVAQRYRIGAVPSFVLVDGQGRIIHRLDQAASGTTLQKMMAHYRVGPREMVVRGQNPPAAPVTRESDDPIKVAMQSTVRLQVEDDEGNSFGTGTVIDIHRQEALVVTCGHIFRSSDGKGRITIDRFDGGTAKPTTGTLISYDMDTDIGLVSMKLASPIRIAKLAAQGDKPNPGDSVFSIGCSSGEPPSVMKGNINQVNKYLGPPNITASGQPVVGRSGGGLFNSRGELIGVCSAADPELDEGLYGALQRVHYELDRNGLSFVYKNNAQESAALVNADAPQLKTVSTEPRNPVVELAASPASTGNVTQATHEVAATSGESESHQELVCVLKGEDAVDKVFVIKNPSRILLEYLTRETEAAE